jgi:hypothetical protein
MMPWLLNNERKPPKGFEKFFKKKNDAKKSSTDGKFQSKSISLCHHFEISVEIKHYHLKNLL